MSKISPAKCSFDGKTLRSENFDDIYFNASDAIAESNYVFIEGNRLPERWSDLSFDEKKFTIIETGFGSGLNFLLAVELFLKSQIANTNCVLNYITFEKHPIEKKLLAEIYQTWPFDKNITDKLLDKYPPMTQGMHEISLANNKIKLSLYFGDATEGLQKTEQFADCIFLDGFAPDRNEDMWSGKLFDALAKLCKPGCTLATFTAAGSVKKSLRDRGFTIKRQKGFGTKWHMITGFIK